LTAHDAGSFDTQDLSSETPIKLPVVKPRFAHQSIEIGANLFHFIAGNLKKASSRPTPRNLAARRKNVTQYQIFGTAIWGC
jgi:hypothetical protein